MYRRRNVSAVRYELGFYISEDDILHSHRLEDPKCYTLDLPNIDLYVENRFQ
jgi:hypothetical protein